MIDQPSLNVPPSLDGRTPCVADQAAEAVRTLHTIKAVMRWLCALLAAQLVLAVYWLAG